MADLIKKGKIRSWAMSRATAEQIREANAICPLAVIQNEYSMMVRTPEQDGVLKTCDELGIGFTPYMPLAVGFLTGAIKPGQVYKNDDAKRTITWFTDENLKKNQPVFVGSPVVIECELIEFVETENFTTVLARVVNMAADESVLGEDGKIDTGKIGMIFYESFSNSYYFLM